MFFAIPGVNDFEHSCCLNYRNNFATRKLVKLKIKTMNDKVKDQNREFEVIFNHGTCIGLTSISQKISLRGIYATED